MVPKVVRSTDGCPFIGTPWPQTPRSLKSFDNLVKVVPNKNTNKYSSLKKIQASFRAIPSNTLTMPQGLFQRHLHITYVPIDDEFVACYLVICSNSKAGTISLAFAFPVLFHTSIN